VRGNDHARPFRRIGKLSLHDCGESQVAQRAAAVPALVPALGDLDLGPRRRVEIRQRREPVDARETVAGAATPLGVEEVVGERLGVLG